MTLKYLRPRTTTAYSVFQQNFLKVTEKVIFDLMSSFLRKQSLLRTRCGESIIKSWFPAFAELAPYLIRGKTSGLPLSRE